MIPRCRLIEETIGFYIWKERIKGSHHLIRRHVYVDNMIVKNRILNYASNTMIWRSERYRPEIERVNYPDGAWHEVQLRGKNRFQSTRRHKWYIIEHGRRVHYSEDTESAEEMTVPFCGFPN